LNWHTIILYPHKVINMPIEIRELIVRVTVEENTRKQNDFTGEAITEIDNKVNKLEAELAALSEKIDNIYSR
jgi:hypothetical protein